MKTTKVRFTVNRGDNIKVGDEREIQADQAGQLIAEGYAVMAEDAQKLDNAVKQLKDISMQAVKAKIATAKRMGAIAPKDETVEVKAMEWLNKGASLDMVTEYIDSLPVSASSRMDTRVTHSTDSRVEVVRTSLADANDGYVKATQPQKALILAGNFAEAGKLSQQASAIMASNFYPIMNAGGDFAFRDVVQAAGLDVADPDTQVGTLATGIILMRNLGFLKNKLNWFPYLTTDLRNEPCQFGQTLRTRYITPPDVLTYLPGVGYTSSAVAIANASATTAQDGIATATGLQIATTPTNYTLTKSAPSATDVDVKMDQHKAVELEFPVNRLASTLRNLMAEQYSAQMYSLAETINKFMLTKLFAATWTGTVTTKVLGQFSLTGMVGIKLAMTLGKVPDVGRFILLHSIYHDQMLTDTNLVTAKAILALINKNMSAFESGELPVLYGVKPLESQLAASKSGSLVSPTDPATVGSVADKVGFAGNSSSALFVARVPQDYTKIIEGIPATAAMEIVTEPDSGLSLLVCKYVNHEKASVSQRCALMYGAAQGDPRIGIILTP